MKYLANVSIRDVMPSSLSQISNAGIGQILRFIVEVLLIVGIVLTVIFIIIAGIQWAASGGDKEKIQKSKARLTFSLIGLIVILLSFFIINIIGELFGVKLIR